MMEYEFGKICWINKGQRFGDRCVMLKNHYRLSIFVWDEKEEEKLLYDKSDLSPIHPIEIECEET